MEIIFPVCYNLNVMKTCMMQFTSVSIRRALGVFLALAMFFVMAPVSKAEDGIFALGDCSDTIQRVETRLADLGYLKGVVNGRWDQLDADAFSAFAIANGVSQAQAEELLYSGDAIAASQHGGTVFASGGAQGFLITYGSLMPWEEVAQKLVVGQSYNVTSCYSGISLHMVCISVGNHAKLKPELEWDNATLRGFFNTGSSSEKQPIVITIDGVLIAASIQQAAPVISGESLPEYSVYFHNSLTEISGIADAEHEEIVLIAANQQ